MWYEVIPSVVAMGACFSLIEISPFVFHYLSWGCPMMRHSTGPSTTVLQRRDCRLTDDTGFSAPAAHMYTYGLNVLKDPVKLTGNIEHYKEAEKKLALKQ